MLTALETSDFVDLVQPLPAGGYRVTTTSFLPAGNAIALGGCAVRPQLCAVIAVGAATTIYVMAGKLGDFLSEVKRKLASRPCAMSPDCQLEWEHAYEMCIQLIGNSDAQHVTHYQNVAKCAKGLVSERCGGNAVN